MRRAVVGAIFLVAAATASAFVPPPRERPYTLEEAAHLLADWEVIFEGTITNYELTSLPTPLGHEMWCTRITFAVERGLAGEPDSVIQALTIAFPTGMRPPPTGSWSSRSDQVPLPMAGSRGLFFVRRAGRTQAWACNPSRLLFSSSRGSWIESARGIALFDVTDPPQTFDYDQLVAALEATIHVRSLRQLTSQASIIARVVIGPQAGMTSERGRKIRYPITITGCYRGDALGPSMIAFEDARLLSGVQEQESLVNMLRTHEGSEALIFGVQEDSGRVALLPGGWMPIDQRGNVTLGLKAAGDTATVILRPLASIEQQLR
jgi:hypothetical protein